MKYIKITPQEYITNFCKIAKFKFTAKIIRGKVLIRANILELNLLGW